MARETLAGFYHSAAWKKQRQYILMRDHFKCQMCGAPGKEIHHKVELNEDNVNDSNVSLNENNLITLCHDSHNAVTSGMKANTFGVLPMIKFDSNGFPIQI